jgi:putative PEP-CTERM system TPR-repeat lipoprotein
MLTAALPDRPGPELRLAEALVATKELGAAHRSLERALKNAPGLIAAQRALAEVAVMQKQPAEAIEIARGMQRAQPKQAAGYLLEADVQMQVGHPELAIPPLRAALPLAATSATAVRLHRALEAAQHPDESGRLAVSWLRDHPQDVTFRFYLGDLALARRDWPGAEVQYRKVVEIQPDNALALNNIAWLLTKLQKPGATAMAERANQLLPGRPALMDTLAAALAADNQTQRAIDLQQKAIARAPEEASLKLTLAKIYLKAGDRPKARTQLENLAKLGDKFSAQGEVVELLKSL